MISMRDASILTIAALWKRLAQHCKVWQTMALGSKTRKTKDKLNRALRKERLVEALEAYDELERLNSDEPRWAHRKGDLLKRMGQRDQAVLAYTHAVDLYAQQGFVARAAAMAKVILNLDPSQTAILERVNPEEARRLHRSSRTTFVSASEEDDNEEPTVERQRLITDALSLELDANAGADEVRFKSVREDEITLEIDISDVEVVERESSSSSDNRPSAEELAQLPSIALFAEVPQPVLARIVEGSQLLDVAEDGTLIDANSIANALYVLVEGSVEIRDDQLNQPLGLSEGDVVGEACLLADTHNRHEVVATTQVRALKIQKTLLDNLVERYPFVGDVLLEILTRRLISTLLRTSPLFEPFDASTRGELARAFEVRRAEKSTVVLELGKKSDGLYIPLIGEWIATTADGQSGQLKLGRALGQQSLLSRGAAEVTVKANTEALVLRMPADRFNEVVEAYPSVLAYLQGLAHEGNQTHVSLVPPPISSDD